MLHGPYILLAPHTHYHIVQPIVRGLPMIGATPESWHLQALREVVRGRHMLHEAPQMREVVEEGCRRRLSKEVVEGAPELLRASCSVADYQD